MPLALQQVVNQQGVRTSFMALAWRLQFDN
jgi:hypothetical protein